jgi:predicted RNA methylase
MSSTNRGGQRLADDFYETPAWCTEAILPHLPKNPRTILEPAAGSGAIVRVLCKAYPAANICAVEIDPGRADMLVGAGATTSWGRDFLVSSLSILISADLVVMNPPYSLAMPFVQRCLRRATVVAALLRLPWLASKKRAPFHREHPSDVYVLPRRPSFTPDGKTDSCDYAWFVWGMTDGGHWKVL